MPVINIKNDFPTLSPKTPERRSTRATVAVDVDRSCGTLAPFMTDKLVDPDCANAMELIVEDCCHDCYTDCVDVVRCQLPCVSYYRTRAGVLEAACEPCGDEWCPLEMPCTLCAPTVEYLEERCSPECQTTRSYAYYLVDKFGNKTPMSGASEPTVLDWDVKAMLLDFEIPAVGCWETVVILSTSPDSSGGEGGGGGAPDKQFFEVGKIDVGTGMWVNDPEEDYPGDLYDPKQQRNGNAPLGLHSLQKFGKQLGGIDCDGDLYMSKPGQPGAWDHDFMMRFPDKAVTWIANDKLGYVLTKGHPAVVDLKYDCAGGKCHAASVAQESFPIVSKRSAAASGEGVIYASTEGLVYMQGTSITLLTKDLYTKKQWLDMHPNRMHGIVHQGYYFGTTDTHTFRLRLPDNIYDSVSGDDLVDLSIRPTAYYRSRDGRLFFSDTNGLWEWNAGAEKKTLTYRTASLNTPLVQDMTALQVRMDCCDDACIRLFQGECDMREIFKKQVFDSEMIRLPRWVKARELYLEVEGVAEINQIKIGPDPERMVGV